MTSDTYIGSMEEKLTAEVEMQDAPAIRFDGEPRNIQEWSARLAALDAEMDASRPIIPDTSHLPLDEASRLFAQAIYCGVRMEDVPERVTDEWERQDRESWEPRNYPGFRRG